MAGSGKRADQKKPSILKLYGSSYFGKKGFVPHKKKKIKTINLFMIEKNLDSLANKDKDCYIINLQELGYNKLLGTGQIKQKVKITCQYWSKKAEEKVKAAGGEIIKWP